MASACAERDPTGRMEDVYDPGGYVGVNDPIEFTDTPYDFTGDSSISDLIGVAPPFHNIWYGIAQGESYPIAGDCDPGRTNDVTEVQNVAELPMTIEGVVTLHPRFFQKITVCGTDERYYGSYVMQDSTGGIMVLKDSRLAEFDVGDRVRLRVRGMVKFFSTIAVLAYDEEEVINEPDARYPIYYEQLQRRFLEQDIGLVKRVRGRVVLEATNQNFNEMRLESLDDSSVHWLVTIDRELGTRGVAPALGDVVELTAPVLDSFGLRMIIGSLGMIEVISQ
ncbi:MAG: hypothetical protein ACNA8W_23035 [Bradymonadaceae bacterium]